MAGKSNIEWTEHTWNPIVGCSIVSPGCTNCYAMKMAGRLEAMAGTCAIEPDDARQWYYGTTKKVNGTTVWTGKLVQASDRVLTAPLRRKKPTTYFVNSMGDLFHESIPDEWIDRVFAVMALCPQHMFQVLTKRAERMRAYCASDQAMGRIVSLTNNWLQGDGKITISHRPDGLSGFVFPNVWLGVSCERQQEADERIPHLLQTPAAVRFVSAEPLLGPVDISPYMPHGVNVRPAWSWLDWVIAGGESGPNARPMHPDWARALRDQCREAGVAYFFKQWGNWAPDTGPLADSDPIFEGKGPCAKYDGRNWEFSENGFAMPLGGDGEWVYRLGKKAAGRLLDGREHNAMPRTASKVAS